MKRQETLITISKYYVKYEIILSGIFYDIFKIFYEVQLMHARLKYIIIYDLFFLRRTYFFFLLQVVDRSRDTNRRLFQCYCILLKSRNYHE